VKKEQDQWGLYPWFPERGPDYVHPEDFDAFAALPPYGRVFRVAPGAVPYVTLIYGEASFRVTPELIDYVGPPAFSIGDRVRSVPPRTPKSGTIREIHWHHKQRSEFYLLRVADQDAPSRYWRHELEPVA
jgi:hypothetical protein